jgi:hypothetical protein
MIQDLRSDSQRWQQERTPGEAGRGGSHSPHVRDTKVSRGPNASLVAYQDSRTHAARQHWGPSKPFDHPTEPYEQATSRQPVSSRTAYPPSSYAGSDTHYTTTPTAPSYGGAASHPGYQQAAPASAQPRTAPADPYSSSYQQPAGREPYPGSYSSYSAQAPSDYGRSTTASASQYSTPRYFGYFDEQYLVYR